MKKVCIINIEDNKIMRYRYDIAEALVTTGKYRFTTKSKLRSYLNRDLQLTKNGRVFESAIIEDHKSYKGKGTKKLALVTMRVPYNYSIALKYGKLKKINNKVGNNLTYHQQMFLTD